MFDGSARTGSHSGFGFNHYRSMRIHERAVWEGARFFRMILLTAHVVDIVVVVSCMIFKAARAREELRCQIARNSHTFIW
jgi:hypothetical protein